MLAVVILQDCKHLESMSKLSIEFNLARSHVESHTATRPKVVALDPTTPPLCFRGDHPMRSSRDTNQILKLEDPSSTKSRKILDTLVLRSFNKKTLKKLVAEHKTFLAASIKSQHHDRETCAYLRNLMSKIPRLSFWRLPGSQVALKSQWSYFQCRNAPKFKWRTVKTPQETEHVNLGCPWMCRNTRNQCSSSVEPCLNLQRNPQALYRIAVAITWSMKNTLRKTPVPTWPTPLDGVFKDFQLDLWHSKG